MESKKYVLRKNFPDVQKLSGKQCSRAPYVFLSRIQTFSISKSYTSSIVLPGRAILEELILRIGLAARGYISLYCPVDEAIGVCRDPVENSFWQH